ncbi:MAG: hypothetical protein AAF138_11255 [Planctomycetota bacterium]
MTATALRLPLVAGLAGLAVSATSALAGAPGVVDRIPADTGMFIAIPNLQSMLTDITAFTAAHGDSLPPEVGAGLAQIGVVQLFISQPGMNAAGSAAVVLMPTGEAGAPGAPPPMDGVGILPITDFAAFAEGPFISSQNPEMEGGVLSLDLFGNVVHIRDLDGYAVVGADRDLVANFDGAKGQMGAHEARMGAAGDDLAGSADAIVVANIESLAPAMQQGLAQLEQQAQFLAAMGGGPAINDVVAELKVVATNFLRDGSAGFVGLDVSADGVAFDLSAQFKEGSQLGELFAASGDSDELVDNLPRMDFLVAGGVDLTNPGLKTLFEGADKLNTQMQAIAEAQGAGSQPTFGFESLSDASGFSGAIGTAPALGGGGIFANSVAYYRVEDTKSAREDIRKGMLEANGTAAAGVKYATTHEAGAQQIAGLDADIYAVSTTMDANAPAAAGLGPLGDPAMIQQMMFGFTGGPNGFIADAGDGLFMTVSKNSQLLERTVNASRGDAPAIDAAAGFQLTRGKLPEDASAQIYVAADQIANAVGPFLVMMGMQDEFQPADQMAPVGVGVTTGDGAFAVRAFVPGDVIGFLAQFAPEDDFGGGNDGGAGAPPF